jgi:hypothetical protein
MRKNAMDMVVVKEIKEDKWKEREEKKVNKVTNVGSIVGQATQKVVEKWTKAQIVATWIPTIVKEMDNKFH